MIKLILSLVIIILSVRMIESSVFVNDLDPGFIYETMGKAFFKEQILEFKVEARIEDFEKVLVDINATIENVFKECLSLKLNNCGVLDLN
jgi:hypothetical protein